MLFRHSNRGGGVIISFDIKAKHLQTTFNLFVRVPEKDSYNAFYIVQVSRSTGKPQPLGPEYGNHLRTRKIMPNNRRNNYVQQRDTIRLVPNS